MAHPSTTTGTDTARPPSVPSSAGRSKQGDATTTPVGCRSALVVLLLTLAVVAGACGGASAASPSPTSTPSTTRTASEGEAPLVGPKTTPAQDTEYITDVTKADAHLASYAQQQGDVALQAMLTDGAGFCAFLRREGAIDKAILDTALGAKSLESETHLPYSVTTFNTLEAVALLTLCPAEQSLVPSSVRAKIHRLGSALGRPAARGMKPGVP